MSFCIIWQWAREEKIPGNRLFANFLNHISVGESRKLRFFSPRFSRSLRLKFGWCQNFIFSCHFLSSFNFPLNFWVKMKSFYSNSWMVNLVSQLRPFLLRWQNPKKYGKSPWKPYLVFPKAFSFAIWCEKTRLSL